MQINLQNLKRNEIVEVSKQEATEKLKFKKIKSKKWKSKTAIIQKWKFQNKALPFILSGLIFVFAIYFADLFTTLIFAILYFWF